jgi:hypothetical protein
MALFAEAKRALLLGFLRLPKGLLSHDTFSLLSGNLDLCSVDPDQFRASFQRFMAQFSEQLPGGVAVNGRGFGRSFDRASGGSRPAHDQRSGAVSVEWRWPRPPPTPSRMRSPRFRNC